MTKHRVLIEFESDKPLPADFTDQIAGRVYSMNSVVKGEVTAAFVGDGVSIGSEFPTGSVLESKVYAAKDTQ